MTTDTEKKTYVQWYELDISFKRNLDVDALFAAVNPPDDVLGQESIMHAREPDTLKRRLLSWGWASDDRFHRGQTDRPTILGVYGDYTYIEDDERLMPLLAPFIQPGSRVVFEVSRTPGRSDFWENRFEAWAFDGRSVKRHPVERRVEYV